MPFVRSLHATQTKNIVVVMVKRKLNWKCTCGTKNIVALQFCGHCKCPRDGVLEPSASTFEIALRGHKKTSKKALQQVQDDVANGHKSRQSGALLIASDKLLSEAAEHSLRSDYFSNSTVTSYASEIKFYENVMLAAGMCAWPITVASVTRFASILKSMQYRGAKCYLSAVVTCNRLKCHHLTEEIKFSIKMARQSVSRGLGDDFSVEPITLNMLDELGKSSLTPLRKFIGRLGVIGLYFCFRPNELVTLKGWCTCRPSAPCSCGASVRVVRNKLTITLKGDKTHQSGVDLPLSLNCCCKGSTAHMPIPTCPVCCMKAIYKSSAPAPCHKWHVAQGPCKGKPLSYNAFHDGLIEAMRSIGRTVKLGNRHLYGGQSLRRGGAQALAIAGWSLPLIRLWGRWAEDSQVVRRYVMHAPLWCKSMKVSKDIHSTLDGISTRRY